MEFSSSLNYVVSGTTQMFQFYYFSKKLLEQIVCVNRVICPILNFIIPLERVLFDAFLTVNYLNKIREQQLKENTKQRARQRDIDGIVKILKRSYSIKNTKEIDSTK